MEYRIATFIALMLAISFAGYGQTAPPAEALKATIETTFTSPEKSGTRSELFIRDSQGRVRIEHDQMVMINDPVAQVSYRLDTATRIAYKMTQPERGPRGGGMPGGPGFPPMGPPPGGGFGGRGMGPGGPGGRGGAGRPDGPGGPGGPDRPRPEVKDLGTQVIEGFTAEGREISITLPPRPDGNGETVTRTTQNWFSKDLSILLLSETTIGDKFKETRRATGIQRNPALDATLFAVPDGYKIVEEQHGRLGDGPGHPAGRAPGGRPAQP